MERSDVTGFTNVDATHDSEYFIRFLDARKGVKGEHEVKDLEIQLLAPVNGDHILDVGCGTGDDVRAIAALVEPDGKAVGVDASAAMVEEAERRSVGGRLPVEFAQGDVYHLEFEDATFDGARTDRVLANLVDPVAALAEIVRVVKPRGRVVLSEVDFGTAYLDSSFHDTTRRILSSFADRAGSGWVGRSLPRLLRQAGLQDVVCVPRVLGLDLQLMRRLMGAHLADPAVAATFAPGEQDAWWEDLATADAEGHFQCGATVFTAAGRKA